MAAPCNFSSSVLSNDQEKITNHGDRNFSTSTDVKKGNMRSGELDMINNRVIVSELVN